MVDAFTSSAPAVFAAVDVHPFVRGAENAGEGAQLLLENKA